MLSFLLHLHECISSIPSMKYRIAFFHALWIANEEDYDDNIIVGHKPNDRKRTINTLLFIVVSFLYLMLITMQVSSVLSPYLLSFIDRLTVTFCCMKLSLIDD